MVMDWSWIESSSRGYQGQGLLMFMFMKVTIDLELECPNSIRGRELIRKQLIRIGRGYIMTMISIIIFI